MTYHDDGYYKCLECEKSYFDGTRLHLNPVCNECWNQPERSKREDLIEMIVPPEADEFTKLRLEHDLNFVRSRCGISSELLGSGALNSMET